ncbi:MAG TPA: DUF4105 domain-containing protein [Candidatus Coprenecus stercoravium]|uniref:DUF4105 domain-containing protein n=1 Tax=Candidatus Coprenecus stercoravium TaxID=2840735 RepID=A0A9D2GQE8_9BACT|nr:DUF4105 domain-containing protein [Candidatus Coprenecus stercoravium]
MMKRLILTFFAVLLATGLQARDSLSISLLTCSQGKDISSAFGHSAIRVKDVTTGEDLVFNYGTFSFEEPHFFLKFLRGDLNYCLSVNRFHNFKYSYEKAGRGIIEQPLNLTPWQENEIYLFLTDNALPENRFYLYDFLQDNCATRIRDIFDREGFLITDTLTGATYRDELTRLVGHYRWMMFGIDLLLGAKVDREISVREAAFLPDRLSQSMALYANPGIDSSSSAPLASECRVLLEPDPAPGRWAGILSAATGPFPVFVILLLFYLLFFMRTSRKWRFMHIFSTVLYAILGTGGVILCLMWFATNHIWTENNWNLLWMNPLMLIPVFLPNGVAKNLIIDILTLVAVLGLVFGWLIPQTFHPAVTVIILLLALVALSRRSIYRKY